VRRLLRFAVAAIVPLTVAVAPALARAQSYAPLDRPGPPLDVPIAKLRASLQCTPSVAHASREPVLLNPATGATPDQNYSWNWERALNALRVPWCTYTAPSHTLADIQVSGEYLVYAIRTIHALAGRRIAILGHSQGGMSMRWPLRFWPDTRAMVDDVIGFAGTNHGTTVGGGCAGKCPPADWQQAAGSNFISALNSHAETFAGISYTEVYSHRDEEVQPNMDDRGTSSLRTGSGAITNVATQDICPNDIDEHLMIGTVDPVAYALGIDALTHPGPADPARISRSVCGQLWMPGVDPLNVDMYLQILAVQPGLLAVSVPDFNLVGAPEVAAEPPLACYVFATCAWAGAPSNGVRRGARPRPLRRATRCNRRRSCGSPVGRINTVARHGRGAPAARPRD
jgi:hypothetical protein